MKKIYPAYYKDFKCIADKCKDNCCIGWEIDIDNDTYGKYKNIDNTYLKNKMEEKIGKNDENYFFKLENERCPFLDKSNLCEIISIMGEEYLCEICNNHPRYYNNYGDFYDIGIGLSCPEANRLILSKEYNDNLIYDNILNDDIDNLSGCDKLLLKFRQMCFEIINKDITLFEKVNIILYLSYEFQDMLDEEVYDNVDFDLDKIKNTFDFKTDKRLIKDGLKEIIEIYLSLEILDKEWEKMLVGILSEIDNIVNFQFKVESYKIERVINYFIFRYLITANDDRDIISKIQLSITSAIIILIVSSKYYDFDEVARMYSKEIDYSDVNTYDLQQNFIFSEVFYEKNFKQMTKLLLNL